MSLELRTLIHMMSQINAPFHSYEKAQTCCRIWDATWDATWEETFFYIYRANEMRYIDSDVNLRSPTSFFNQRFQTNYFLQTNYFSFTPCSSYFQIFYSWEGIKGCPLPLHPNQVASSCILSNSQPKCVNVCKIYGGPPPLFLQTICALEKVHPGPKPV